MTSEIREQFLALFVQISFAVQSSDGAVQEEKLYQESSCRKFSRCNYMTAFSINPSLPISILFNHNHDILLQGEIFPTQSLMVRLMKNNFNLGHNYTLYRSL